MTGLDVRPATGADVDAYLALRDRAAARLQASGIDQWRPGELDRTSLAALGWAEELHGAWLDGTLVGGLTVLWADPTFWGDETPDDGAAGYVHGLLVDDAYAGRGLGRDLLTWAERHVAARGRGLVRLDTLTANARLVRYYVDAGYRVLDDREVKLRHPVDGSVRTVGVTLFEKALAAG